MASEGQGLKLKIAIIWLAAFLVGGMLYSTYASVVSPLTLSVLPQVPREGEPVLVTLKLKNPQPVEVAREYSLYIDGRLVERGEKRLPPFSMAKYQYAYPHPIKLGEQVSFLASTTSGGKSHARLVSLPSYPPQVWSSFTSFASFSTSVMSSMSSMAYYQSTFGVPGAINVGLLIAISLVLVLVFLELSRPLVSRGRGFLVLAVLGERFDGLSTVLFIIFGGIVFSTIVLLNTT